MKKSYTFFGVNSFKFSFSFLSFFLLLILSSISLKLSAQQTGDMRSRHNVSGSSINGATTNQPFEIYDAALGRWIITNSGPSILTAGQTFTLRDGVTQSSNANITYACKIVIGEGNAAAGVATINSSGVVTGITITDPGKLIVNPFITFIGSSTTLASATTSSMKVAGYDITNSGANYTTASVRIGNVWGATTAYSLNTQVNSGGNLYTCTTAGTSGTTAPTGTGTGISDGTAVWSYAGEAATATATIGTNPITSATGAITALTISKEGSGYISMPAITITGDGSGATVTCLLGILAVNITNGGSGYAVAPTVYFGSIFQIGNASNGRTAIMNGGLESKKGAGLFTAGFNQTINLNGDLTIASPVFAYTPQTTGNVSTAINFIKTGTANISGNGSITFRNTSVGANTILKINTNATAKIAGIVNLNSTGTIDATEGNVEYLTYAQAPIAQTIANNTYVSSKIKSLTINNTAGVTLNQALDIDSMLNVQSGNFNVGVNLKLNDNANASVGALGNLNITAGTTDFNNKLVTLQSSVSGTATISNIVGTLSNATNVTIQKFILGGGSSSIVGPSNSKRGFRFLAHPFSTNTPIKSLMNNGGIDITGVGGIENNFSVNTGTNNPSAFRFVNSDITDNTPTGLANGWVAFTSGIDSGTNGASASLNRIGQYKGLRVMYRGLKGTGLDGNNYTVGSATVSLNGTLNTGTQTIPLDYNSTANSGWNLIGNPFPSNVNMALIDVTRRVNIDGAGFYVWNPSAATRGAYETVAWGSAYVLPSYASFFVQSNATGGSLEFRESDKVTTAPTQTLFGGSNQSIQIQLTTANVIWDALQVRFQNNAKDAKEQLDAVKLANPDIDWYTISSDNFKLAIDTRKLNSTVTIPVGIKCNTNIDLVATVTKLPDETNNTVFYLKDKFLDKLTKLEKGAQYAFQITNSAASKGDDRFELIAQATSNSATATLDDNADFSRLKTNLVDNNFDVLIKTATSNKVSIKVYNQAGQFIAQNTYTNLGSNQYTIPASQLSSGMYFIEVKIGTNTNILKAFKN